MKNPYFGRILTAMITPFAADGSLNLEATKQLVEWWIAHGTDALVVTGSTGEAATMTMEEKKAIWATVVKQVNGRIPVIAGTGSNNTANSVETTKIADEIGVDTAKPIILYNVPGRTAANIPPTTVARIAKDFKNVVAIKEAAGNVAQVAELFRLLPADFTIYSGDDGLLLPFASVGATGVVSVLSNIGGEILQDLMTAYESGDVKKAAEINKRMVPLANSLFIETNPIPVKAAVTLVTGIDAGAPRLPLTPMTEGALAKMKAILAENGLI